VQGYGDHIQLLNLVIHDMHAKTGGGDAMGISVYGSDSTRPISNLLIQGNLIHDCQPGHSESLTLNGNVDGFTILNNTVHDVDNIGIDMIGGEGTCPVPANDMARNGTCEGNTVYHARSNYGGGYAAGIYVDGGVNITVQRNIVHECDLGMEIGCENKGRTASGMLVRDNLLYNNDKAGLAFGGYNYPATGKVTTSTFTNNTCFHNDVLNTMVGEFWIQYALNCLVYNNIFYATDQNKLMTTIVGNANENSIDYNLWFCPGGADSATVDYNGTITTTYGDYLTGSAQDADSRFGDPMFTSIVLPSPNVHLQQGSPAIGAGRPVDPAPTIEYDLDGNPRPNGGRADLGAYLYIPPPMNPSTPSLIDAEGMWPDLTFRWHAAVRAVTYRLQIASDSAFASSLALDDSTLADTSLADSTLNDSTLYFWRVNARDSNGVSGWSTAGEFSTTKGLLNIAYAGNWNLVSLPLLPSDALKAHIFPGALTAAYAYTGSYLAEDTLSVGEGYWIKFAAGQNVGFNGPAAVAESIEVTSGWNLVGSPSNPISSALVAVKSTEIQSRWYGYEGGYAASDTLYPGRGYWVKVSGNGVLVFTGSRSLRRRTK
jgi:hypothetical protein